MAKRTNSGVTPAEELAEIEQALAEAWAEHNAAEAELAQLAVERDDLVFEPQAAGVAHGFAAPPRRKRRIAPEDRPALEAKLAALHERERAANRRLDAAKRRIDELAPRRNELRRIVEDRAAPGDLAALAAAVDAAQAELDARSATVAQLTAERDAAAQRGDLDVVVDVAPRLRAAVAAAQLAAGPLLAARKALAEAELAQLADEAFAADEALQHTEEAIADAERARAAALEHARAVSRRRELARQTVTQLTAQLAAHEQTAARTLEAV